MTWLNNLKAAWKNVKIAMPPDAVPTSPTEPKNVGTVQSLGREGTADNSDSSDKKSAGVKGRTEMPFRQQDGFIVPDYAAWCSGWWQDCFTCPEYMANKIMFCRKWNLGCYGTEIVTYKNCLGL